MVFIPGAKVGELVVAEVGLLCTRRHDEAVERRHRRHRPSTCDVTVFACRSIRFDLAEKHRTFFCLRSTSRVVGAISPSDRMPVAT